MMSPRRWIILLIFYISYLMFGASIYYHIEHNLEKENRANQLQERIEINEYIVDQLSTKNETTQNTVLEKITSYCGKPVTNYTTDQFEDPYKWTFYHAFFFSFTVLSTVGYGNLAPTTTLGRMIMIAYSIIGIPINGILYAGLGEYFGNTFTSIYTRYKKYKMSNNRRYVPPQLGLFTTVCIALVPGITVFIVLPSFIFSYFESWPFLTSVYYSYVTMTTIGFGDFVPTFQPQQPREFGAWFVVYQIFIIVWFIFSLGYLVMIFTFITKGLRSKKLSSLEYQLSENIKATNHRIWNGVSKDVGYLRRILNELYIMKFKPVYNEPLCFTEKRSISCPDLTMYRVDPPVISRKRAFSECYGVVDNRIGGTPPFRTSSDTELSNINKQKTFETAETFKQTTDLLAQVVSALASIRPPEDDMTIASSGMHGGYHGFSDSQILSSEWSFPPPGMQGIPQRGRAFSDFNLNPRTAVRPGTNEWTWSGDNNQIQEAINVRCRNRQARENYYKSAFPTPLEHSGVVVDIDRDEASTNRQRRKFSMADGGKQFFKKLIPFRKRSSQGLIDKNGVMDRKFSITSVPEVPDTVHNGHYSTINVGHSDIKKKHGGPDNIQNMFANGGPGASSLMSRRNTMFDVDPHLESYPRSVLPGLPPLVSGARKRRESLFTQNPNMRRGSMFPGGIGTNRRGSLFADTGARNRGAASRRPSHFSVTDEDNANQEILENTTIADLIRALEVIHTQAVLNPPVEESANDKKKRKLGTAAPPALPPIFSIFNSDEQPSTSGNRLYSRRSTIVGPASNQSIATNILTRRRPSGVPVEHNDPPPSYTEKESPKFKRRFSVRPTNLQTPPGMAPPPPPIPSGLMGATSSGSSNQNTAQTALQRRLSLRPSPLARETNDVLTTSANRGSSGGGRPTVPPSSSSTHSPLSRIVQISQAQRKNSEQKDCK